MDRKILARQFLALYLLLAIIGQGIFVPEIFAAPSGNTTITVSVRIENQPPQSITNLNAAATYRSDEPDTSTGCIKLNWTAPVDLPNNDRVFSYIIRYATFSIENLSGDTTVWWNHASVKTITSQNLGNEWGIFSSTSPGGTENIVLSGLIPGKYYWFSGKAVDRYNNKSEIDLMSQSVNTQTYAFASTSKEMPGKITTLAAAFETGTPGRINLSWIASGNDNDFEEIVSGKYRIMYSTAYPPGFIDNYNPSPNWGSAASIYLSTSNVLPGTKRCLAIDNLTLPTTYFFKIWVADEWYLVNKSTWNWSYESYVSSAIPYFEIPVNPVTGFTVTSYASTSSTTGSYVKLNWTNPSKWNFKGVKICSSTVVSDTTDYPALQDGGFITLTGLVSATTGEYTFVQLKPRTSYFYSIYAFDEGDLHSSRTTGYAFTSDVISPDAPAGLTALDGMNQALGSYIELNWYNPNTLLYQNSDWNKIKVFVSTASYPQGSSPANLTSLERTLPTASTGYVYADLAAQSTYYFSVFNYDGGNNGSSATVSVYIWKDLKAPDIVVVSTSDMTQPYSLDESSGAALKLSLKLPQDADIKTLYIAGQEERYPVSYDDGAPELSEIVSNPVPNSQINIQKTDLMGNTTYYFGFYLFDQSGNVSSNSISVIISVPHDNTAPLMPQFPAAEKSSGTFTLKWEKANYEYNLTSSEKLYTISTTTPRSSELFRYQVYESNDMKNWKLVKRVRATDNAVYTAVSSTVKFYKVRAVDIAGEFSDSVIIDSSDEMNYYSVEETGSSYLKFSKNMSSVLFKPGNSYNSNVYLKWIEFKEQEIGPIIKSWKIEPNIIVGGKYQSLSVFGFNQGLAELSLGYGDLSGSAQPSAAAITQPEKFLSNFYFNGNEWLKLPSSVDSEKLIVQSAVKFLGSYQIRVAANNTELTFYKVFPKIITPNGDGKNDKALFQFENPRGTALKIKIFDITGALVKDLGTYNSDSYVGGTIKSWDATDINGDTVAPGTYIYQIEGEGKTFNGTIVVAR